MRYFPGMDAAQSPGSQPFHTQVYHTLPEFRISLNFLYHLINVFVPPFPAQVPLLWGSRLNRIFRPSARQSENVGQAGASPPRTAPLPYSKEDTVLLNNAMARSLAAVTNSTGLIVPMALIVG